jgi:hypothetical protein
VVLVAEGEPDWWALSEVGGASVAVVAVCGGIVRWDDAWTRRMVSSTSPRLLAVVAHHGKVDSTGTAHGHRLAAEVARSAVRVLGEARAGSIFRRFLLAESDDAADMHRRGELRDWLLGGLLREVSR